MTVIPPKSTAPGMLNFRCYTPFGHKFFMEVSEDKTIDCVLHEFAEHLCTTCISQTGIVYRKDVRGWHASGQVTEECRARLGGATS